jgi:hypothetical protein
MFSIFEKFIEFLEKVASYLATLGRLWEKVDLLFDSIDDKALLFCCGIIIITFYLNTFEPNRLLKKTTKENTNA